MGKPRRSKETLVVLRERKSRRILGTKVRQLKYAVDGFKELLKDIPKTSLTFDNGPENARYEELEVPTYFCHPYSSFEKGSVENGIGRIRQFIPKKADLADYSEEHIQSIIELINNMPMKCLSYRTPKEVFEEHMTRINRSKCCT